MSEMRPALYFRCSSLPQLRSCFQAGELSANAAAEERPFNRKWNLIFIAALAVLLAALVFVALRPTPEADHLAPQVS
jgi:hypothetical protein